MIGWLHTDSLNGERDAEMTEKKIGKEPDQEGPDQEPLCQRWKEELSNPIMEGHDVAFPIRAGRTLPSKYARTSIAQS